MTDQGKSGEEARGAVGGLDRGRKPIRSESFTFFSAYYFRAMYQSARASQEIERELDRNRATENACFAIMAVTSSVAFLESHINELFMLVSKDTAPYRDLDSTVKEGIRNLSGDVALKLAILPKYDLVLGLNRSPAFDHGAQPYQDAAVLVQLRNAIMHYQTGFRCDYEELNLEKRVKGKFPLCAFNLDGPLFPQGFLGAGCAIWAAKTAQDFADDFHRRLEMSGFFQMLVDIPALL